MIFSLLLLMGAMPAQAQKAGVTGVFCYCNLSKKMPVGTDCKAVCGGARRPSTMRGAPRSSGSSDLQRMQATSSAITQGVGSLMQIFGAIQSAKEKRRLDEEAMREMDRYMNESHEQKRQEIQARVERRRKLEDIREGWYFSGWKEEPPEVAQAEKPKTVTDRCRKVLEENERMLREAGERADAAGYEFATSEFKRIGAPAADAAKGAAIDKAGLQGYADAWGELKGGYESMEQTREDLDLFYACLQKKGCNYKKMMEELNAKTNEWIKGVLKGGKKDLLERVEKAAGFLREEVGKLNANFQMSANGALACLPET